VGQDSDLERYQNGLHHHPLLKAVVCTKRGGGGRVSRVMHLAGTPLNFWLGQEHIRNLYFNWIYNTFVSQSSIYIILG